MDPFVHLHLHTQYSLLDGANRLPDVIEVAAKHGQPAIAITDHGNLHGAIEFYDAARKLGIKPIIGCELYVTAGPRHERKTRSEGGAGTFHLTVLAMDMEGYRNLCRLVTLSYREGFYFKPRVDHEILELYSKGLLVLSGCLVGELAHFVGTDDEQRATQLVEYYAKVFPGRFYLEVQPHAIAQQGKLNAACIDLGRRLGVPLVATTDCHYIGKDDHYAQEVLMCISTGKQVTDPDRLRHEGVSLYLKNSKEMGAEFASWDGAQEAIRATLEVAERCNLEFDFSKYYMPQFGSNGDSKAESHIALMAEKARAGLDKRLQAVAEQIEGSLFDMYRARLEEEIRLIDKMGFGGYFLVVADFIVWAKERGISVGPGRGSVAGSLVAYALRITDVDPIKHKLLFERFLNPERISLPDIDVDFCIYGRDKVIEYVVAKYGKENVAQIVTFGTLKAKAAIKDVGRALGRSYAETDRIAQLVPAPRQGFDVPLKEALKVEKRLAEYAEGEGRELITLALKLEGLTRHTSTHAAGVVIGDRPLIELLPMMVDKDGNDVTQYSMKYVEKIGLVKFDFLGLKTLSVIHTAVAIIKSTRGIAIDLEAIALDDKQTYALLCGGNTTGVFQLEGGGITEMTMRLKPTCFDDLVAILALFRPGPLDAGMVDHYISRKHGREAVSYLHPKMKESLADTYGIILYQEQIMQLARELAGYSLGEADLLRRAMGKKDPEEMARQRQRFLAGAAKNGIDKGLINTIFDQMETFGRYGFNRSHSVAYALISLQTAYLKAHYPVEFMAALMSHEMDDSDKTLKNMNECRKQGIAILPPDVNLSDAGFSVSAGKIRFGLEAVKGIGTKAVEAIQEARKNAPFSGLEDFVSRVDLHAVNKRVVEGLVKCGAFDYSAVSRNEMNEALEDLIRAGQSLQREANSSQISLFGGSSGQPQVLRRPANLAEWPVNQKLSFEREALGFYISGHPLEKYETVLKRFGAIASSEVRSQRQDAEIKMGGVVTALRLRNTKKGDRYASFVLEDAHGGVESIAWPDVYRNVAHLTVVNEPVLVGGRADVSDERCTIIVNNIESLLDLRDKKATHGVLALSDADDLTGRTDLLLRILAQHQGRCPVKVKMQVGEAEVNMVLRNDRDIPVCVEPSERLCDEVERLFGRSVLHFM